MKILITGGAGFIGSSVADRLLEQGHKVLVLDNYQTGKKENNASHPNLTVVEGSVADEKLVTKIFSEFLPEIVLHAAASYKDPDNWEEDISTNIIGTINIARAAKSVQAKKLIYLQTSLCYGLSPLEKPVSTKHPMLSGGSSYAVSKTTGELYLELSGQEFISFRLANIYGPRNLSGPLPTFFNRLTNTLACTIVNTKRDFVFIDDVVRLIQKAISGKITLGNYHIATGKDHSIKELFDLTLKYMQINNPKAEESKMRPDDVQTILLDASQTKNDFGWQAETTLEEGVKKTIQWYKLNSLSETYTHLKNFY